jgi:hypothetical protein
MAGPPFLTDDPEPVEYRHWEFILATQQFHDAGGWSGTSPHLEINYGLIPDVQLHVLPSVGYNKAPGEAAHFGYGDSEAGFKYRFVHETDYRPQIAIFPAVELPTGDRLAGLGNGKAQLFLPVWMQKTIGPWTTFGGGGYWFNPGPGNRDNWFAGWAILRKLTPAFSAGMEIQFRTPDTVDSRCSTALNFGGTYDFSETYHVLFSAGHSVHGPAQFQGYLGLQVTFGPRSAERSIK